MCAALRQVGLAWRPTVVSRVSGRQACPALQLDEQRDVLRWCVFAFVQPGYAAAAETLWQQACCRTLWWRVVWCSGLAWHRQASWPQAGCARQSCRSSAHRRTFSTQQWTRVCMRSSAPCSRSNTRCALARTPGLLVGLAAFLLSAFLRVCCFHVASQHAVPGDWSILLC
jgi:hypothetical protein